MEGTIFHRFTRFLLDLLCIDRHTQVKCSHQHGVNACALPWREGRGHTSMHISLTVLRPPESRLHGEKSLSASCRTQYRWRRLMRSLAPFLGGGSFCAFSLAGHRFLSRVTTLRVDLLVAIKIIRLEIFTSHQTGTSTREVVIETKLTSRLYCT